MDRVWTKTSESYPTKMGTGIKIYQSIPLYFIYNNKVYKGHYNPTAGTAATPPLPKGCFYNESEASGLSSIYNFYFPAHEVEQWSYLDEEPQKEVSKKCTCDFVRVILTTGCKCGGE